MKNFDELAEKVRQWASDRRILENGNAQTQLLKLVSEIGELADAVIKGDRDEIRDGIGDSLVVLVIVSELLGESPVECLALAYDVIKDRKGYLSPSGAFIKEA